MEWAPNTLMRPRCGLVLPGGGARGAYQVGVLRALADLLPARHNPFPVMTGVSAGAINSGVLASHAHRFPHGIARLEHFWGSLRCADVYRTGWLHNLRAGVHWLTALALGGLGASNPRSLLDNSPLADLLARELRLDGIRAAIAGGHLHGVAITAAGYTTNRAVSFFDGQTEIPEWTQARRIGRRARLNHKHLLASAALPFIFPATRLGHEYYGDGGLRLTAPLSPAIRLGADRLLIIGTRDEVPDPEPVSDVVYPGLGDIGGYVLDVIFMDHLQADLARLQRINKLLAHMDETARAASGFRSIQAFTIRPSEDVRLIAARHAHRVPRNVRALFRGVGANGASRLPSFLVFEAAFCRELMDLGYEDGKAAAPGVAELLQG